jgi:hypothetical protein
LPGEDQGGVVGALHRSPHALVVPLPMEPRTMARQKTSLNSPALNDLLRTAEDAAATITRERQEEERQVHLMQEVVRQWGLVRHFLKHGADTFAGRLCDLLAAVDAAGLGERLGALQRGDGAKQAALDIYRDASERRQKNVIAVVEKWAGSMSGRTVTPTDIALRDWLCSGLIAEILNAGPPPTPGLPLELAPDGFHWRGCHWTLTGKPYHMLKSLLSAQDYCLSVDTLREAGWPKDCWDYPDDGVKQAIKGLRKKLRMALKSAGDPACNPVLHSGKGADLSYHLALPQ